MTVRDNDDDDRRRDDAPDRARDDAPDRRRNDAPDPAPRPGRVQRYLARTRRYGWFRFLLEATAVALLLRIPVIWIGVPFVGDDARTAFDWLEEYSVAQLVFIAVVVGPLTETVIAQWLPIALVQRFLRSDAYAVLISAWLFGWLHYNQGALLVLIMCTTGLVLAWTFVVWRERGLAQALLMTTAVHALLNTVALTAAFYVPQQGPA